VYVTVVAPGENCVRFCVCVDVQEGTGPQLSVAVGGVQLTVVLHADDGRFTVLLVGQFKITGAVAS
jgi:hypothetical protein